MIDAGYDVDGLNITAPSSSGRKSTGKSSGGRSSYSGNPGGYTTPSTKESATETKSSNTKSARSRTDNIDIIAGMTEAVKGKATIGEQTDAIRKYYDSINLSEDKRIEYAQKYKELYR